MTTLPHIPRPEARAAITSLVVGIVLMAIKFLGYFLTGSSAIFSDALESIVNVVSASVALYALSLAHSPADSEHPYGHGKVEFLSAGLEGAMILFASGVIVFQSIHALAGPDIKNAIAGIYLIGLSVVVNGLAGLHLIRTGKKQKSITLEADGRHLMSDAMSSIAVLIALFLVKKFNWKYADPIAAIIIAAFIARIGINLVKRSLAGLMDEQDLSDQQLIQDILDSHMGSSGKSPKICSYHKLRHRHSGRYHWVDFHIMVPKSMSVKQGHDIASAIEYEIEQALEMGNATAHIEPCVDEKCPTCSSTGSNS